MTFEPVGEPVAGNFRFAVPEEMLSPARGTQHSSRYLLGGRLVVHACLIRGDDSFGEGQSSLDHCRVYMGLDVLPRDSM